MYSKFVYDMTVLNGHTDNVLYPSYVSCNNKINMFPSHLFVTYVKRYIGNIELMTCINANVLLYNQLML